MFDSEELWYNGINNECTSTLFKTFDNNPQTWRVGMIFMRKNYVVYDLSPYHNYGMNYIQVGIGRINSTVDLKALKYDPLYSGFSLAAIGKDTSYSIMPNYDIYTDPLAFKLN